MNTSSVGLVVAGAVARGAYEAGALSVLLPELEERGERPTVLVGTSSGALNAAFLASRADEPAESAATQLTHLWRTIERNDVYRISVSSALGLVRRADKGLLDTRPLEKTITAELGDRNRIAANIENGHLDALAVVATAASTSRSTVFVEKRDDIPLPPRDDRKGLDYVEPPGGITPRHLLASAAVPIMFAPVEIGHEEPRWFVDGGVRLNTPIKPAIELGAHRIVVVATNPVCHHIPDPLPENGPPDWDDSFLQFLQAAIADPLIEDVYRLARVNSLIYRGSPHDDVDEEGVLIEAEGRVMHPIPYMFVGPTQRGTFGARAAVVARGHKLSETRIISQILGSQGTQGKELLSYVLFDPAFATEAIELGRKDASQELDDLAAMGLGWRTEPIECRA
jgi:NTE family protein